MSLPTLNVAAGLVPNEVCIACLPHLPVAISYGSYGGSYDSLEPDYLAYYGLKK